MNLIMTTTTLKELLAQKAELEAQILSVRAAELSEAITKVRALIEENGLTQDDIYPRTTSGKTRKITTTKVPAKYQDPVSGKTWSGRGLAPKWLNGKNKVDFLIK